MNPNERVRCVTKGFNEWNDSAQTIKPIPNASPKRWAAMAAPHPAAANEAPARLGENHSRIMPGSARTRRIVQTGEGTSVLTGGHSAGIRFDASLAELVAVALGLKTGPFAMWVP